MYTQGTKFPMQSMVAKRGLADRANISYPYVKKSFKTARHNSNPSRYFGCNQTLFRSKKQKKAKVWV